MRTEDEIRNNAGVILGFDQTEQGIRQGTGQITSFAELGFADKKDKPDGWYLPDDTDQVAIILETKAEKKDLDDQKWVHELAKNVDIVMAKYAHVIGILYNGTNIRVFENNIELKDVAPTLQNKQYYIDLILNKPIDKDRIYDLTRLINNKLHFDFKMNDLKDRMVFTACALVVQRYTPVEKSLISQKGQPYSVVKNYIATQLKSTLAESKKQNAKLSVLEDRFSAVTVADDTKTMDSIIDAVYEISQLINSNNWNGEDVMAIFFNEFSRYAGKADDGQVFTPEHIASLMYRLLDIHADDRVLDATCGSGTFLTIAMSRMLKEVGGINTEEAKHILSERLYGIEFDPQIYALACANMLIHKDGKTNLEQCDSRTDYACNWIREKNITKVLMNPPYERKYGCLKIVKNVLDSVPKHTKCAFILPDKKLEKDNGRKLLLQNHCLTTIIKLPENLFFGVGVTTSIFIFETGIPQGDRKIKAYYIADDGLETVKNKGRQDVKGKWPAIEDYWVEAIRDDEDTKYHTRQLINPNEHLSYQMPEKPFEIREEDFMKTMLDYEMFKRGIDVKSFNETLMQKVLYSSKITGDDETVDIQIRKAGRHDD